jgi:pimeloyl-ACP methyl ester carboxylesterase
MRINRRQFQSALVALLLVLLPGAEYGGARGEVVTLRNGLRLEGAVTELGGIAENPLKPKSTGPVPVKKVVMLDDDLRRVFFPQRQIASLAASEGGGQERILLNQRVAREGRRLAAVGQIIRTTRFDDWGRRILTMTGGPQGTIDLIQGITAITPVYTRVQGLQGGTSLVSDMRIRTSTLPRATLSRILMRHIDTKDSQERLRIARLYIQSERYRDARDEVEQIMRDFPERTDLEAQVRSLYQLSAGHLIREIEQRRGAGQHQLVQAMVQNFPSEGVAGETLLRVREIQRDYQRQTEQRQQVIEFLDQHLEAMTDEVVREIVEQVANEIRAQLGIHSLPRMADYLRLADDDSLTVEQRLALAVSGWLLGPGRGTNNLSIAASLLETRRLVIAYLQSTNQAERDEILQQLAQLEGGTPRYVSQIIETMDPLPSELPPPHDEIQGLFELTTPGLPGEEDYRYFVQLPPEYDPQRRYPCVLTLHGAGTEPTKQIEWWSGTYSQTQNMRLGQSSRRGYIVIAPAWPRQFQNAYEYSAREHAVALLTLRDACRRFSIDSDRVFLSGHSMGGDAAWDLAVAHPDLWAGVVMIGASTGKYIPRYWKNANRVPMYFVFGELDGSRMLDNSSVIDRYMNRSTGLFDMMVVEYRGRGHEHFFDEIQEIYDWMGLASHRRDFHPKEFEAETMRPWDSFFWWTEVAEFPERTMVLPANWPDSRAKTGSIQARALPNNRVTVSSNANSIVTWLTPEIVNFDEEVTVVINRREAKNVTPSLAVMLEDVRTRGDRQNPFWAKVEYRGGRIQ